jgi:hypothetical protein
MTLFWSVLRQKSTDLFRRTCYIISDTGCVTASKFRAQGPTQSGAYLVTISLIWHFFTLVIQKNDQMTPLRLQFLILCWLDNFRRSTAVSTMAVGEKYGRMQCNAICTCGAYFGNVSLTNGVITATNSIFVAECFPETTLAGPRWDFFGKPVGRSGSCQKRLPGKALVRLKNYPQNGPKSWSRAKSWSKSPLGTPDLVQLFVGRFR